LALVNLNKMLNKAKKGNYAVGAFNIFNIEDISAVLKAAEETNSPVILMTNLLAVQHSNMQDLANIIRRRAQKAKVPVCFHLDHSSTFEILIEAISKGYSSVMYDGSMLPYAENVAKTREIVKVAHVLDISVEAEIGRVGRWKDEKNDCGTLLSDPEQAAQFIEDTGIDACAISIGTIHGMQKQETRIDFLRLKKIKEITRIPLVLHGSSGVVEEDLKQLGPNGIQKVNVGTYLRRVFTDVLRTELSKNPNLHCQIQLFKSCMEAVEKEVINKMNIFGCIGKA